MGEPVGAEPHCRQECQILSAREKKKELWAACQRDGESGMSSILVGFML